MVFEVLLLNYLHPAVHYFPEVLIHSLLVGFELHRQQYPFDLFLLIDAGKILADIPDYKFFIGVVSEHSKLIVD